MDRFQEILNQVAEIHERNRERGGDDLLSFKMCEKMGVPAWKGVLVMMAEEMGRLMNVAKSENPDLESEAVGEMLNELAAHSIMTKILLAESPGTKPQESGPRRGRRPGQRERKDAAEIADSPSEGAFPQPSQE